jgi:opacity protein-like surface antigen
MKKSLIAIMALTAAMFAQADTPEQAWTTIKANAGEPYVASRAGHNFEANINPVGVVAGSKWGKIGAEVSFDRSTGGSTNVNQWGIAGSYDVLEYKGATLGVSIGAAYIDPSYGPAGWQGVYGVGASYPVAKNVALTTSYTYQTGDRNVDAYNGGSLNFGVKYKF